MASQPPDLPESIVLGQFAGIKNTVSEERLAQGELSAAVNVDIDDAGQLRRRRGYARRATGSYHSLKKLRGQTLVVKDGVLGYVRSDFSHEGLTNVGEEPLTYAEIADVIYFASSTVSGKIVSGQVLPWGAEVSPGQWISPVIAPTPTMGAISGRLLGAPPVATEIAAYKGRIYLAHKRLIWATELYLYDLVDKTRNFIQTEEDITLLAPTGDGIYVGTTARVFFLQGTLSQGLKRSSVMDAPAVKGSLVYVPQPLVHPSASRGNPVPEDDVPVFMTGRGIVVGLSGGELYNLTQGRVAFPGVESAAALYREDQGANSYVAVANSGGSPTANARIGDYVEAEIIRASQRG